MYSAFKDNTQWKKSILKNSMELHCNRKPNKIWVDKGGEFYNNSF